MKYGDLVQFEPIDTIVQVVEANDYTEAQRLVRTFVISDRMAEKIKDVVLPHLQFEEQKDNKALLIVGNYGTGKSHLMSVISTLAEHAELLPMVQHAEIKNITGQLAGKFKVFRTEIGASTMPLRDIICQGMTAYLETIGVDYTFPPMDKVTNNKDCLLEMMAQFYEQYPEQGFLVVVDELLDYLRTRKSLEIILDLNFLREIGESCKATRFRFMAGVQESLFDSDKFQFVGDTLRRVKDRFEQLRIAREDVAYVVANRLLKKDERQKALIRTHLEKFYPLYENMAERSEQFVTLFPVHPAYLEVFEKVYVAEKREVLKTISATIGKLINKEVPEAEPALVSFDAYWEFILENPALRSMPDVRIVVDKSQRLEGIINTSFTIPLYKPAALKLIRALSVHRLTTGDINTPIGLAADALRDGLCLHLPMPEEDAEFLKTTLETVLKEIRKTVSGQFISFNKENEQYYLDPQRDIDYESEIEKRADLLSDDTLNRFYFNVLTQLLERGESMVTGHKVWEYELEWKEKRASRVGWLFFGAPNERSTAQPPRDFYLYFLAPFGDQTFTDEKKVDEIFFVLERKDDKFSLPLKLYAAAVEMALISQGDSKKSYNDKAVTYRKEVVKWISNNLISAYEVAYKGVSHKFVTLIKGAGSGKDTREVLNTAASSLLSTYFQEQTPDYPTFSVQVTTKNRDQYAQEAIRWIATNVKTDNGAKILDSLELLEGNNLRPADSRYAKFILEELKKKGTGQVVNRQELIQPLYSIDYAVKYRLEPEWVAVILVALVYDGAITLALHGGKYDASNLEDLAKRSVKDIMDFKHIEPPKDLPLAELKLLFEFLGLPPGQIVNPDTRENAVNNMQKEVKTLVEEVATLQPQCINGVQSFGINFLTELEKEQARKKLDSYKNFLESLQVYKTPAKLKNFRYTAKDIKEQQEAKTIVVRLKELLELKREIDGLAAYINQAELAMPSEHVWAKAVHTQRQELTTLVIGKNVDTSIKKDILGRLKGLKDSYIMDYMKLHKKLRLDVHADTKKKKLLQQDNLKKLNKLKEIELMPKGQLQAWTEELGKLKPCYSLVKEDLDNTPVCPHCYFNPVKEVDAKPVYSRVEQLEEALEQLVSQWTENLLGNLEDPIVSNNIALITKESARARVQEFIKKRVLPEDLDSEFINAIKEVLSGLVKMNLTLDEVKAALLAGGSPCTIDELKNRFTKYLDQMVEGKELLKVRIILE
ncbi:MAG: DUF6079 family protein [Syntrophomonadaceae bacterium]|nr:DUF6079 family protein [Syntrophomonadaceae bacterium]